MSSLFPGCLPPSGPSSWWSSTWSWASGHTDYFDCNENLSVHLVFHSQQLYKIFPKYLSVWIVSVSWSHNTSGLLFLNDFLPCTVAGKCCIFFGSDVLMYHLTALIFYLTALTLYFYIISQFLWLIFCTVFTFFVFFFHLDGILQAAVDFFNQLRQPSSGGHEDEQSTQGCSVPSHQTLRIFSSPDCCKVIVVMGASQVSLFISFFFFFVTVVTITKYQSV